MRRRQQLHNKDLLSAAGTTAAEAIVVVVIRVVAGPQEVVAMVAAEVQRDQAAEDNKISCSTYTVIPAGQVGIIDLYKCPDEMH